MNIFKEIDLIFSFICSSCFHFWKTSADCRNMEQYLKCLKVQILQGNKSVKKEKKT